MKLPICAVLNLEEAAVAQKLLDDNKQIGKVILAVGRDACYQIPSAANT